MDMLQRPWQRPALYNSRALTAGNQADQIEALVAMKRSLVAIHGYHFLQQR